MTRFKVTFKDEFEADSEIACYDQLLAYLSECLENGDVMAFDFEELPDKTGFKEAG